MVELVYNILAIHADDLGLVPLLDRLENAYMDEPDEEGYLFVHFSYDAHSLFDKACVFEMELSCSHAFMVVTDINGEMRGPFGEYVCHRDQDEPWPDFLEPGISAGEMVRRAANYRVVPRGAIGTHRRP